VRLGVYDDHVYCSDADGYSTDRAAIGIPLGLAERLTEVVLFGRLDPEPCRSFYSLPKERVRLVPLRFYPSVTDIAGILRAVPAARRAFLGELNEIDAIWVFGPNPLSYLFVWLALRRHVPVILGVRQEFPGYIRNRLPSRKWFWAVGLAHIFEWAYRRLARRLPTIVVSEALGESYRRAGAPVLVAPFSLVSRSELAPLEEALARSWHGAELCLLTVGRLDSEKNPMLLPEILAELRERDPRWRLIVVGQGPLDEAVRERAAELGVESALDLRGYVPSGQPLWSLYRSANAFLHVSLTEGLPQVLVEANAAGAPIVATDVGGVRRGLDDGRLGLLIPPRDAHAAVHALERLRTDEQLRTELVRAGLEHAGRQTKEAQLDRIAEFIREQIG
jgi:glycosyltransferase involved in cell wall biosynthesis